MKLKYLIPVLLISFLGIGQTYTLPKVIPPAPETAQFTKFVDFPADLSTGQASTSIPIYTIQEKELSFPITLSYDASGLKPNDDVSGLVGLKWSLNAFGVINRSISVEADEKHWNELVPLESNISSNNNNLVADPDAQILSNLSNSTYKEVSTDIFSYRFPNGEGGKFVFPRNSTLTEFLKPITLPYSPIKIVSSMPDQSNKDNNEFNYFEITDKQGVLYRFGKNFKGTADAYEKAYNQNSVYSGTGRTAWMLTEMISASKKDTIFFEYDDVLYPCNNGTFGCTSKMKITPNFRVYRTKSYDGNGGGSSYSGGQEGVPSAFYYSQKKITKIRFKTGYVTFSYQYVNNQCFLQYIQVFKNGNTSPIQTFKFYQSQFSGVTSDRLNWYKLDGLEAYNNSNIKEFDYDFGYYTSTFPEHNSSLTSCTFAIDYWGYYNGENQNNGLIPNDISWNTPAGEIFGGNLLSNRSANYNYSKIGMLQSIKFPSGGMRTFVYEGNMSYGNPKGGVRIGNITNTTDSASSNPIVHIFDYGTQGGVSLDNNSEYYKDYSISYISTPDCIETLSGNSSPNTDITIQGMPVLYSSVTEYIGTANTNTGKIVHLFDTSVIDWPIMDNFWLGNGYMTPGYPWAQLSTVMYPYPLQKFYRDKSFGKVNETSTTYYDSQNQTVKSVQKYYSKNSTLAFKGFETSRAVTGLQYDKAYFYYFYNYNINQLHQQLDSIVTTDYRDDVAIIRNKQTYTYNSNLLVSSETTTNSLGQTVTQEYKYPFDLVSSEQSPYMQQLVDANRIAEPVITKTYNGTDKLSEAHAKYTSSLATNNIVLPVEVHANKGTMNIDITSTTNRRIVFNKYDKWGNVLEYQSDGGISTTFLYGYSGAYPVAKIENATFAQVLTALSTTEAATQLLTVAPTNLRTVLPDALITTYTYDPLIGVTSITDPKGYTTYYEYDEFNRLKQVKDQDGNITSANNYHYKGQ